MWTVMSGTLGFGMGDKFDKSKGQLVKPGGFFVEDEGDASLCVGRRTYRDTGAWRSPLVISYVNPSDDPSTAHN